MTNFLFALFIIFSFNTFAQQSLEDRTCTDCWNFVAPSVLGSESVTPAEVGLITYDSDADAFRGYNNNGNWVSISNNLVIGSASSNVTLTISDAEDLLLINTTSSAVTVNLPTAVDNLGKVYQIKKTTSDFNLVTIDPNSTETIDGQSTRRLSTQGESIKIVSDGTNWQLISRSIPQYLTAYTPTYTGFGYSSSTVTWVREGKYIYINGRFAPNSPSSTEGRISLPTGLTVDTSITANVVVGQFLSGWQGDIAPSHTMAYGGNSYLTVGRGEQNLYWYTNVAANGIATNDPCSFTAKVPIQQWD